MKKKTQFEKITRTQLKKIKGGGTVMKTMRSCGPSCTTAENVLFCFEQGCGCYGTYCAFN
ncbi:ComC/BlpC family leader-containing pheromone/bacteriocin [Chitinophaga pendula]|uniref:ComC/BlpC family leader-containing pheromone/bacteriocin n=1 Tax=Chitinophaga TaxID=79328 RepID=UPI000BAF6344|nr:MULTISPECIES: ComC/BlpC family leader-containing pheromone/bacteriocin [Chitinophaga]ASZ12064.1 hypothetical protein CK934_14395 [Chitinophaga sp. MD30]UCJ04900.1 ComC/BlpC family leader-containing pheromone/bacteriocin [Chitinophaga pendula]